MVNTELARLAEEGTNATKAIEQWRAVYRQDPANEGARDALKRLYKQTGGWNALTDLLRGELERVPAENGAARLPILREVAAVYRDHIKSDSALVTVLSQIVAIDREDIASVQRARADLRDARALARSADDAGAPGRSGDGRGAKAELYRSVARRWLDQFSNVQNAIEAYEQVFAILHDDVESKDKLKELYGKRRAYKPLYELLEKESSRMAEGPARREIWLEMARLASERLDRGADATRLYKKVLEDDPSATGALDALEKQAERDKDWKTVSEVLERRATIAADDTGKLAVLPEAGRDLCRADAGPQGRHERVASRARSRPRGTRRRCGSCATVTWPSATTTGSLLSTPSRATGRASSRCSRALQTRRPTRM